MICERPSLLSSECQCHGDFYCQSQRQGLMAAADQDIISRLLSENRQFVFNIPTFNDFPPETVVCEFNAN